MVFNSRDKDYRDPTGAVKNGTPVHFRINMPRYLQCSAALLIIDSDNSPRQILGMFWCGMNGNDNEWWECHFQPTAPGVYYYHFEARTNRGSLSLYKGVSGGLNTVGNGSSWQLTVYSENLSVPDWLAGGIIYQIFPDRFNYSGEAKENVPSDRYLRSDWGGEPYWEFDSKGIMENNDYFQGDLKGIEQKLPYLVDLGVTCIYLNPIFEAHSNHRYNTADYSKIDPLLGTEEDFKHLCTAASEVGIRIILDGVFNHTGSDSVYFNREKRYDSIGAFNSTDSPYYPWYMFKQWPDKYESWWNFDTLPNVNETNKEYGEYINGKSGIIKKWLKAGASGWRLDVTDELPDQFIEDIVKSAKEEKSDAFILGEVWEDASNKFSYGIRRKYFLGNQLDSVMNYPFRDAILGFLNGYHSSLCMEKIENLIENYPPEIVNVLMNHIGTHDTERAITVLGGDKLELNGRKWQSCHHLTDEQWEIGSIKLRLASLLQFTLPGVPCIYYGDEAGAEGYKDPFNRGCYPWGKEHKELISWYKTLAHMRKNIPIFKDGSFRSCYCHNDILSFERYKTDESGNEESIFIAVNRSDKNASVPLDLSNSDLILGTPYSTDYKLPPYGFSILRRSKITKSAEPDDLTLTSLK